MTPGYDRAKRDLAAQRREAREQRTEQLENVLYDLATSAENEMTRVNAAVRLHAIYAGQPVARQINHQGEDLSNLSDDELRDELARLSGA